MEEPNDKNTTKYSYNELLSQKKKLTKELKKCRNEKENIYRLWKDSQEEGTNVRIINQVIEQEQEKADAKDLKVLMMFEQKDKQLNILQEVSRDLHSQLSIAEEKISKFLIEISDLEKKKNEDCVEKDKLKELVDHKEALLDTVEKQLSVLERSKIDLEKKFDDLNEGFDSKKEEYENRLKDLMEENSFYQKTIESVNEKFEIASKQAESVKIEFMEKEDELKFIITKLDDEAKRCHQFITEVEQKDNKIIMLEDMFNEKCKESEDMLEKLETLENEIQTKDHTIKEISEQLEKNVSDIHHMKNVMRSYESYPKQVKDQIELIRNLEQLQDDAQQVLSQQEVAHQKELFTYQSDNMALKDAVKKCEEEVSRALCESKTQLNNNKKMKNNLESLQKRENTLQQELVSISIEFEAIKNELHAVKSKSKSTQDAHTSTECLLFSSSTQTSTIFQCDVTTQTEARQTDEEKERFLVQEENKALKGKISSLEAKYDNLYTSKLLMEENEQKIMNENEELTKEISHLTQKLEITNEMMDSRARQLEKCSQDLNTLSALKSQDNMQIEKVSTKLKCTEEELHIAVTNCSKLSFQLKSVCGENEILMEKQKALQQHIAKMERMVAQKKSLLDDMRTKNSLVTAESEKMSKTIDDVNKKLKKSTDREQKTKLYNEKLKTRLESAEVERSRLHLLIDEMKVEIGDKAKLLHETQHICRTAEAAIEKIEDSASHKMMKEMKVYHAKEKEFNSLHQKSLKELKEHRSVVKNFAESILSQIHEKRELISRKNKKSNKPLKAVENPFERKACDVACSILNMSANDFEEFMMADICGADATGQKYEDNDIREKLDMILKRNENFAKILTQFLLDLVKYYSSICAQLAS